MVAPLKLGVVGLSPGNGHPFSFSAIINGFTDDGWQEAGWALIHDYLRERDASEFGFPGVRVTHAWTQDPQQTALLCRACNIGTAVSELTNLIGEVDALVLARDDYARHLEMAPPFLEAGLPVFIDKPLALEPRALEAFTPYLLKGQLMSCSGFRFARELDALRANPDKLGAIRLVRGAVLNDWETYGIHLLEAVLSTLKVHVTTVTPLSAQHASLALTLSDGTLFQLDALGQVPKVFQLDVFGSAAHAQVHLSDNFSAFRRTLWHFVETVRTGQPAIPPHETLHLMHVLQAGRRALTEGQAVSVPNVADVTQLEAVQ